MGGAKWGPVVHKVGGLESLVRCALQMHSTGGWGVRMWPHERNQTSKALAAHLQGSNQLAPWQTTASTGLGLARRGALLARGQHSLENLVLGRKSESQGDV